MRFALPVPSRCVWPLWCATLLMLGTSGLVRAADPAFVGSLALLAEDDVVRQLELTGDQKDQISRLIERREAAALELAVAARQLEPAEKDARQAAFVAESEREGLQLLTEPQRDRLQKLKLRREGLAALARPEMADQLGLTSEQRQQLAVVLERRASELAKAEGQKRDIVIEVFSNRLDKVLTEPQRSQWAEMTQTPATADAGTVTRAATGTAAGTEAPAPAGATHQGLPADADGRLQFGFRNAPWRDVLDWFATQADLSLVLDSPPLGTFNYTDARRYAPEEAIDVLNSVLLTKGYTLVRRERMLMLINLEDGIPPNLVTTVPLQDLDRRGEFELVNTLFRLGGITPEDAEQEITKLLGPQGSMQVLPKSKQVFVTETAGRLRTIRDVLRAMEDPNGIQAGRVTTFELQHVLPDDVFIVVRQMLGLPEGQNAAADGSVRMATDVTGRRIMVSGQPELVQQVGQLIKLVDEPMPTFGATGSILGSPQLDVYPVVGADSESVLLVLQTLLADEDVRLAVDPKTGSITAWGLPAHHATIRATIEQMRAGGQLIDVVQLHVLDPQIALLSINRLFGVGDAANTSAPKVEADLTSRRLMIRGTPGQIEQIRSLLEKLGETDEAAIALNDASARTVRVLPLGGSDAQAVLEQIQQIWPSVRQNRIRTVTPSTVIRSMSSQPAANRPSAGAPAIDRRRPPGRIPSAITPTPRRPNPPRPTDDDEGVDRDEEEEVDVDVEDAEPDQTDREAPPPTRVGQADRESTTSRRAVSDTVELLAQAPSVEPLLDHELPPNEPNGANESNEDEPGADIVIAVGPTGLIIASKDREALNDFENLLKQLAAGDTTGTRDFAVFYLRHATADSATQILNNILSGGTAADSGDGGLLGGLAGAALGDMGGGLMGSLLGLGGSASSFQASGSYSIVPETRLNMLVVQANAADMKLIEQLLEIVDQRASPELVETVPPPRMIPVYYTSAESIAEVVRQVFASKLASGPGQQQQPSPEDFIRALRGAAGGGGRGGRGGGGGRDGGVDEQRQLTVGVDARGNQLVVAAPDEIFHQIEALVRELDQEDSDSHETTRVVTLDRVNPEMLRRALNSIVGTPPPTPSSQSTAGGGQQGGQGQRGQGDRGRGERGGGDRGGDMRQQMEVFRSLQQQAGQGQAGNRGGQGGNRGGQGGNRGGQGGGGNRGGQGGNRGGQGGGGNRGR